MVPPQCGGTGYAKVSYAGMTGKMSMGRLVEACWWQRRRLQSHGIGRYFLHLSEVSAAPATTNPHPTASKGV